MDFIRSHKFIVATIVIQLIALPLILLAVKERQETQTQAEKSTTLFFNPTSSINTPLTKNVGESFSVDLMVNPGNNLVSLAKIEINYDPTKVTLATNNPIVVNSQAFPTTVEGPVVTETATTGRVQIVVSVGSDQTKVIQTETKVLTVNMKAVAPKSQTLLSFGSTSTPSCFAVSLRLSVDIDSGFVISAYFFIKS